MGTFISNRCSVLFSYLLIYGDNPADIMAEVSRPQTLLHLFIYVYMFNSPSLSAEVRFQLTENDYRSDEDVRFIPVVVSKNVRLANPVTFLLTPFNESEAISTGQPLPANLPLFDNVNLLSPNRAQCKTVLCIVCT